MSVDFPRLPSRLLLGPGPSNVPNRILESLSRPLVGHLDSNFLSLMDEIQKLSRQVFECDYRLTIPVSGTGSCGMEAALVNFVCEGVRVLVGAHGVFGHRIADCARRCGGEVTLVTAPFGEPLDETKMAEAAERCQPHVLALVHAETSTGVLLPLKPFREICDRYDSLFLVDAVTSLGGHQLAVKTRGVDICFSGTQKCLNCPPGLAPLTVSPRAQERMVEKCRSWYLDLKMLSSYWGSDRTYHHTAPISMNYALHEALALVMEEGLEHRWKRHRRHQLALVAGAEAMGLRMQVAPEFRLATLTTIQIPPGIDDLHLRRQLLSDFNVEIGGGLGELAGKVWRVGLMGVNSRPQPLLYFLYALEKCLLAQNFKCPAGVGVQVASQTLVE